VTPPVEEPAFPDPESALAVAPGCERCPALVDCRNRIAWGNGPPDADLLVVGEAPGAGTPEAERWRGGNWTGMAYTARHSGRRIRRLLADAGFDGQSFYTNAVNCYPSDGEGGNREPTAAERDACRDHLRAEIETVDPTVLVPTGKHATETLLAETDHALDGFLDTVLSVIDARKRPIVPLLHPSYRDVWLSRLGYEYDEYVATFRERVDAIVD
jgi:uracil-DNA glycosylase family 4